MNIDQIISRFFSSEATREELDQLEVWKNEAEENAAALKVMKELWLRADGMKDYQDFDTSKAWNKLNAQMVDLELKTPKAKEISIFRKVLPYAASILLVISAAFFLKDVHFGKEQLASYTTTDQNASYTLKDQSKIALDKGSKVTVLSDFTNERILKTEGRALFDVAKDENSPFTVKTFHGDIRVTGTVFSVKTDQKETTIYLKEGSIQFIHNNKTIDLSPSEGLHIEANGAATKYHVNNINELSWVNNELIFNDQYITEVISSLSNHFQQSIEVDQSKVDKNCKVSTRFKDLTLKQILDELGQFLQLEYNLEADKVEIQHISC